MKLPKSDLKDNITIEISGSKSISNRLLILNYLSGDTFIIKNLSNSADTRLLENALKSDSEVIDIHHAGTAMRFLTSYFAVQEGKTTILTGSARMKERPIFPLVDALRDLGADISYLEKPGYPPLKITGKKITKSHVTIPAHISSQFISSLMLIGSALEEGLTIDLVGEVTSRPYLEMTLKLLRTIGISTQWIGNSIQISPMVKRDKSSQIITCTTESDWSSASYFYSLAAIGRKSINLKSFRPYSLQGDSAIKEMYWNYFGVNTISEDSESKISLLPESSFEFPAVIELNMNDCPDLAQTLCVTATALQIPFHISGLSTLKIKETDRLIAMKTELFKIGCICEITDDAIYSTKFFKPNDHIVIDTYDDHRMAMSFAPYCLLKEITIDNPQAVNKSYPKFWQDLSQVLQ